MMLCAELFHLRPYTNLGLNKLSDILDKSKKLNQLWSGNGETSGEKTFVQANGVMTEELSLHDGALSKYQKC